MSTESTVNVVSPEVNYYKYMDTDSNKNYIIKKEVKEGETEPTYSKQIIVDFDNKTFKDENQNEIVLLLSDLPEEQKSNVESLPDISPNLTEEPVTTGGRRRRSYKKSNKRRVKKSKGGKSKKAKHSKKAKKN